MAYSQHEWVNGEIITAEKLNNIEQGIADCGSREIEASATATVENTGGEPSVEVAAEGSVSKIAFGFAFKGIKGERGERGEPAPTIEACEISIAGSAVTGKLSLSDGSSVDITGTYAAESGDEGNEESPDSGEEEGDGGDGSAGGAGGGEAAEGETEPEGGDGETPEEGESEPESGAGESGGESPDEGGGEEE